MTDTAATKENEGADAVPATPKRKLPLILLLAAGLVLGGGSGAIALGPMLAKKSASGADSLAKDGAKKGAAKSEGAAGTADASAAVHIIDNLVLNPAGSGGMRFLLATIGVQMSDAAAKEAIRRREVEARDVVLNVLGTKKVEDLSDIANRETYKQEIKSALGKLFGPESVKAVYFSQFVIQ